MKTTKRRTAGTISAVTMMMMLASIAGLVLQPEAALARHGASFLDVFDGQSVGTTPVPQNKNQTADGATFTANLKAADGSDAVATSSTLVLAEFEGGPNDPDNAVDASSPKYVDPATAAYYGHPDGSCTVAIGASSCDVTLPLPVVSTTGQRDSIRFWINSHLIDLTEPIQDSGGCVTGGETESDATDLIQIIVIGSNTGAQVGPQNGPVPGAIATPAVCPADGSSVTSDSGGTTPPPSNTATPTPTQSSTSTATPTPTQTSTGSPTPTSTATSTPTSTATPTPTNTGSGPAELSMGLSPDHGVYGTDFVVSGAVTCQGVKVANTRVHVFRHFVGRPDIDTMDATTDVQGRYAIRDTDLSASADYSGAWNGNSTCPSGAETGSDQRRAVVSPGISANVKDSTITKGQSAQFYGSIIPGHPGKKASLQVYRSGERKWDWVSETKLSSRSGYAFSYRFGSKGYLLFRIVYVTQDLDHAWNVSRNFRVDWS